MNNKFYKIGIVLVFIGLIIILLGFLSSERYLLFDNNIFWMNSKSIMIIGLFLFILGTVFRIIDVFLKKDVKNKVEVNAIQKEVYSGICPVCHQAFETTAEIIKGYYVFNCNKCNSKLRVKKSVFFPAG